MCFNFYDSISVSLISLSFVSNILLISTQNVVSSIVYFTVLWFQFVFIVSKSLLRVSISFFSFFHIFLTCLKYQFKNPYLLVSHSESSVSLFLLTQFSFDSGLHFSSNYYILETPGSVTFLGRVLCFILVVKLLSQKGCEFLIRFAKLISIMLMSIYISNSDACKCISRHPYQHWRISNFVNLISRNGIAFQFAFLFSEVELFMLLTVYIYSPIKSLWSLLDQS